MQPSPPRRRRRAAARSRTPGALVLLGVALVGLGVVCGGAWVAVQLPDDSAPQDIGEVHGISDLRVAMGEGTPCSDPLASAERALAERDGLPSARACVVAALTDDAAEAWLLLVELDAVLGTGLSASERQTILDAVDRFHPVSDARRRAGAAHRIASGDAVSAVADLDRLADPGSARHRIDADLARGDVDAVADASRQLLAARPSDHAACESLARAQWGMGDWRGAEGTLADCVNDGAAAQPLIQMSGWIAEQTGRLDVAESRYVAADAAEPLAALLWQTGRDSVEVDALLTRAPTQAAWRALAYGEAGVQADGLAGACAALLDGRTNEALASADAHPDDARWLAIRARALAGTPGADEVWRQALSLEPDNAHLWRGRLAAASEGERTSALAELAEIDPQRAVLTRGHAQRDTPWSVLVPVGWDAVLDEAPSAHRDRLLLWAGRTDQVGGTGLVRAAALSERGLGGQALRHISGDTAQDRIARAAAYLASGDAIRAQAELVGGLDEGEPALRGVLVLVLVEHAEPEAARRAAAVVLREQPNWQALRNALTSIDQDG